MLQRGTLAQPHMDLQVLHHRRRIGAGVALVRFQQYAAHPWLQLDDQQRGVDRAARLEVQLQAHSRSVVACGRVAVESGNTQAQALHTQGTVGPGKRRGFVVARRWQAGKQLRALGRIGGVEPACVDAPMRQRAQRLQRPSRAVAQIGVTIGRCRVDFTAEPDLCSRWRNVAERLGLAPDPAGPGQMAARRQRVGAGAVHAATGFADAASIRTKPVRAISRASSSPPDSAMQPWSSRSTVSGSSNSIICR